MKRRGFFARLAGAAAGLFGVAFISRTSYADAPDDPRAAEILSRITPTDRSLLFFNEMPDGSLRLGDFRGGTLGHSMFGEQGAVVTAAEMNHWALIHDGVIDYDEFLLWKIEHPGQSYIGSPDSLREHSQGIRHYMLGANTRPFLGERS